MNKHYIIVDEHGTVVEHGTAMHDGYRFIREVPTGHLIMENTMGAQAGVHVLVNGRPFEKARLEDIIVRTQIGDVTRFSSLPLGTVVTTYGVGLRTVVTVNDGRLEYETDRPGTHYFSFEHPMYVPWWDVKLEVEA